MSFNAPFTTMGYYSWLFENDGVNVGEHTAVDPHLLTQPRLPEESQSQFLLDSMRMHLQTGVLSNEQGQYPPSAMIGSEEVMKFDNSSTQQPYQAMVSQAMITDGRLEYIFASNGADHSPTCSPDFISQIQSLQSCTRPQYPPDTTSQISTPAARRSISIDNRHTPDTYVSRCVEKLPTITGKARDGLMKIIKQTRPTKPDGSEIAPSDPLLSLSSLQHYSDLFFTRFNTSYPLIHQATFQAGQVHAFLLMAILLLGATYSDKEAHLLAVCIHDIMRPLIHASKEFGTRPKLWMLQTILLVECFGKSRAGERQHDFSHLYHGMLIK
jgi:Fungal specific transcription factor domain